MTDNILSAAPMNNNECHLPGSGVLHRFENRRMLLQKTMRYLFSNGYELNEERDGEFLRKYRHYYDA